MDEGTSTAIDSDGVVNCAALFGIKKLIKKFLTGKIFLPEVQRS